MNSNKSNRLIFEKSPYLLQHAHNPVDWYPWADEAFAKASQENKPIFLSIGYSTCHWCHVMESESFEDEQTAQFLNEHFVSIKVDREERPDLDSIYMSFVMALAGNGGWPLTVFLTPEKKPFYGGTYFPPQPRFGSPAFKDLLLSIHQNWHKDPQRVRLSADEIVKTLIERTKPQGVADEMFDATILTKGYQQLAQNFDPQNAGFGQAPKFPMGHTLSFLLRYWNNNKQTDALAIVEKTLTAMAQGGLCDQLAGGFHRYSTDAYWQVPHFEKMLYDQALLVKIYLEAFVATGKGCYADTARETLEYVLREMRDPQGGFYCAQDADSLEPEYKGKGEKKEGAFYVWQAQEMQEVLSPKEFNLIKFYFGIEQNGNALADPLGEFVGKNILHINHSLEETAAYVQKPLEEVVSIIAACKQKLLAHRANRPRPSLDDKILTDWNSLMISSFAFAGRILNEERYLDAAEKAAQFILKALKREDGRLLHRYRDGHAGILAGLEDYAFFVAALLDLFENTFDPQYLKEALRLNKEMLDLFWDDLHGGFFLTAKDGERLFLRPKEVYDGAIPSGNSVAAHNLLRLYHFTFEPDYLKKTEAIIKFFYSSLSSAPGAHTAMMMALQFYFGPVKEIVLCAQIDSLKAQEMLKAVLRAWIAPRVLIVKTPLTQRAVEELLPLTKGQSTEDSEPLVYVCENQTCQSPLANLNDLKKVLG